MEIDSSPESTPDIGLDVCRDETATRLDTPPPSLRTSISPPSSRTRKRKIKGLGEGGSKISSAPESKVIIPNLAAVEAGEAGIQDHLEYFFSYLSKTLRTSFNGLPEEPRLLIPAFKNIYIRNQCPHGRHFVIHQHDHPIAGLHYDLRLQINETSSISWAIMYGLPGNVNSRRLNRNATETRVHNVWNHLIETASAATGSLLIWDIGEYEMLPYRNENGHETDDELLDGSEIEKYASAKLSDSEKLHLAFQRRRIRIRLNGTRLPPDYTLSIRLLASENRYAQPAKPSKRRRRQTPRAVNEAQVTPPTSDLEEDDTVPDVHLKSMDSSASALEREIAEQEDEEVRLTNAYPGATNDIGSIHQRRWYLSMDRYSSGFKPLRAEKGSSGGRREWVRRREGDRLLGFEPFYVMGREAERSIITGRNTDEVMGDEMVDGFQGRKGWRAITE